MAKIGDKRSAEENPKDQEDSKLATPTSTGFSLLFKPSPLANVASTLTTYNKGVEAESPRKLQKISLSDPSDGAKSPLKLASPGIMKPGTPRAADNGGCGLGSKRPRNGGSEEEQSSKKSNLFMECMSQSSTSSSSPADPPPDKEKGFLFGEQLASRAMYTKTVSEESIIGDHSPKTGGVVSNSPTSLVLPAVETVTGEEGERHVAQILCSLFVFDATSHSWKERGRGELRLNDTPKSEGAYQSRLIMRTSGSRRVCLNTHLWAAMTCERVNKRSIRIAAQEETGGFGIYLIKGGTKDIANLFAAISRRLDALKIASSRGDTGPAPETRPLPNLPGSFDEDDSVLGDRPSSPCSSLDSSPDRPTERLEKPVSVTGSYSPASQEFTRPAHTTDHTPSSPRLPSKATTDINTTTS